MKVKPYLQKKTVKGREYWYFRRGEIYTRIPFNYGTLEFDAAYWELRSGKGTEAKIATSYENLIVSFYKSRRWNGKAATTKKRERRVFESIRTSNGPKDFTKLTRPQIIAAHEALHESPRKADYYVQALSMLAEHAIDLGWISHNPAKGITKYGAQNSYKPWPASLVDAYERYCRDNGLEIDLLVFALAVGTGQRPDHLTSMQWDDYDGEYIEVSGHKRGNDVAVYVTSRLKRILDSVPKRGKYILSKNLTEPLSYDAIEKRFRRVRKAIGAEGYTMHGWRYTAAVELAEAGATDAEIQAVTGQKTAAMAQKYRAKASRRKLSKRAQERRK